MAGGKTSRGKNVDKFCPKCRTLKSADSFAKNCNSKDGLENVCKFCLKEYHLKRRQNLQRIKITEKKCSKCGLLKPVSDFYKSNIYKDGYRCLCIACEKENKLNIEHVSITEKRCNKCGLVKPISEFYENRTTKDNHIGCCIECYKSYTSELTTRQKPIITTKKCRKCKELKLISEFSKDNYRRDGYKYFCKICEAKFKRGEPMKRYQAAYQQALKREVLTRYCPDGILKCADPYHRHKTPETDIDVLTLDHINGGGRKQLKETGKRLYFWVKNNNYPNGFQVLCFSCQMKKRLVNHESNYGRPLLSIYKKHRQYNKQLKIDALKAYSQNGIIQCADPYHIHAKPETDMDVLCIDHINGNGHQHRKENNNLSLYLILRRDKYPLGFQVLCGNCNYKKRALNKEYGHRKIKWGKAFNPTPL